MLIIRICLEELTETYLHSDINDKRAAPVPSPKLLTPRRSPKTRINPALTQARLLAVFIWWKFPLLGCNSPAVLIGENGLGGKHFNEPLRSSGIGKYSRRRHHNYGRLVVRRRINCFQHH